MSWIVNILATLIYLGFGIIYAVGFSKRKHFRYSIVVTAAAIFLTQAGMFLLFRVENWFGAMMWMALGYVLMMLSLWVNVKMTMAVASYYAVWASCTWCLAYELSMVFCWLLPKTLAAALVTILFWGLVILCMPLGLLLMLVFGFWFQCEICCQIVYGDLNRVFHIEESIQKLHDAQLEQELRAERGQDTPEE